MTNTTQYQIQLISLYKKVRLFDVDDNASISTKWTPLRESVNAFNLELANLGYTMHPSLANAFLTGSIKSFAANRQIILDALIELTGSKYDFRTLFSKFPYDTPNQTDYLIKRIIGYLQNILNVVPSNFEVLSNGMVIDKSLFNMEDFEVDPITQFEVDNLPIKSSKKYEYQQFTPLKVLSLADDNFICGKITDIMGRKASVSSAEKTFVLATDPSLFVKVTEPTSLYKENIPLFYHTYGMNKTLKHLSSVTDIMRIAYFMSNQDSDLSLKENVKFKFTSRQAKDLAAMLEHVILKNKQEAYEDLLRNRERWLRVAERLHVGSNKFKNKYTSTYLVFGWLRSGNMPGATFNSKVHAFVKQKNFDTTNIDYLSRRPGEFLRNIDVMLRNGADVDYVIKTLKSIHARNLSTKTLFEVKAYFYSLMRDDLVSEFRSFFPKGLVNKIYSIPETRIDLNDEIIIKVINAIDSKLEECLSTNKFVDEIYIDPHLENVILPFNRRSDKTMMQDVIRGSVYPLNTNEVIRMFVWWKGNIDVDLSCLFLDENFNTVFHVAFTNLHEKDVIHSGDIQNAANGASEFIDFNIKNLLKKGIKYVIPSVISFRGQPFSEFESFVGFMKRDSLKSGEKYEPASVENKFDLTANARQCLPLVFDLVSNSVIYCDLVGNLHRHAGVHQTSVMDRQTNALKAVLDLHKKKPTIASVLRDYARYNNIKVVNKPSGNSKDYTIENLDVDHILNLIT